MNPGGEITADQTKDQNYCRWMDETNQQIEVLVEQA
jgi:hypothetical protein